jgi:hypothetical protein
MDLIAIKDFLHSAGMVEAGAKFSASAATGAEYVAAGLAKVFGADVAFTFNEAPQDFVIIASGPSTLPGDLDLVRRWRWRAENRRVLVINSMFLYAPWADYLYAADQKWWDHYGSQVRTQFAGQRWTQDEGACRKFGARHVQCERRVGLSLIKGVVHHGGNSGHQAINLAAQLGARLMILLGFDMKTTTDASHYHGRHPKPLRLASPYDAWLRYFGPLAMDLKHAGIRVLNATRSTAIESFDRAILEKVLSDG